MRRQIRHVTAGLVIGLVSLLAAPSVIAGPINIVGGSIIYSRLNTATFDLVLTNGRITGEFGNFNSESWTPTHACFGCTPGATLNTSITESFRETDPPADGIGVGGQFVFNGQTFGLTDLMFSITADDIRAPAVANDNIARRSDIAQFMLTGLATGWTSDRFAGVGLSLLGHGKVSVLFENSNWFATTFTFDDPATVPEPASLLLFGTGALGLAARRRIRR